MQEPPRARTRGIEPGVVVVDDLVTQAPDELVVLTVIDGDGAGLELRRTDRRDHMLVAYTSIDLLVDACGRGQPWPGSPPASWNG